MTAIVLTADLPEAVESRLRAAYDVRKLDLQAMGVGPFLSELGLPSAIVCIPGDPCGTAFAKGLPNSVKLVASYSTGLDHIDVDALTARDIAVSNTPGVLTDATADIAMLLLLGAMRGAAPAAALIREQSWTGWAPDQIFGWDLAGRRLGIIGGGKIGAATARRAIAFGMSVAYWSRSPKPDMAEIGATFHAKLDDLLPVSDVISLHLPSTPETQKLIDAAALARLPRGSVLINTGRGDLLDDDAVVAALESGHLAGVGLDVFRREPEVDPRYLAARNAFLLPHMGSATYETRAAMGDMVLKSLERHLA